ncbi:hypothetical protein PQX77_006193 [Marasmius sp. AFHP31]|nr:hypothetical protein PQX77_006193 [Marasmius sp. AFHP31]
MSSYDHTLLGDAPALTKQMRQEGYNPDLLQSQPPPESQNQHQQIPPHEKPLSQQRSPFWRTTKGIIIIAVVILVIIGAVVGGAVGGTVGKHNGSGNSTAPGGGDNGNITAPGGGDNSTNPTTGNSTSSEGIGNSTSTMTGGQEVSQSSGSVTNPATVTNANTAAAGPQSSDVQQRRRRH